MISFITPENLVGEDRKSKEKKKKRVADRGTTRTLFITRARDEQSEERERAAAAAAELRVGQQKDTQHPYPAAVYLSTSSSRR